MNRLSLWWRGLSRKTRLALTVGAGALAALIAAVIVYFTFLAPNMVEVRTGTIVYDPVDGHVWEDDTETLMVSEDEAGNYTVVRIQKLSEEHAAIKAAEEEAARKQAEELANATGYQAISGGLTEEDMANMARLQRDLTAMGEGLITGLEMVNQLYETRNVMASYRDQAAATTVPPELQDLKNQMIHVFDLYIAGIDSFIDYAASMDPASLAQGQAYLDEATSIIQNSIPQQ